MQTNKQKIYHNSSKKKFNNHPKYLKFVKISNQAPNSVTIKSKDDLLKKIEDGIKDTENRNVCTIDEAFKEINSIFTK